MTAELYTEKDAHKALSGKLVFGDETQIRARKFLENVQLAKEAYENCRTEHLIFAECADCDGTGTTEDECEECAGKGCGDCDWHGGWQDSCSNCSGTGEKVIPLDVLCSCIREFSGTTDLIAAVTARFAGERNFG